VNERIPKMALIGLAAVTPLILAYLAYNRPGYFSSQTYLGGLLAFEFLFAALWTYRKVFFPLILMSFVFAGINLPLGSFWTMGRWVFLAVGALAGTVIMLKQRSHRVSGIHLIAVFAVLGALVSAAVSRYTGFALLKVLSLFLLFLYAGTGARLAVTGRENKFFTGLLAGCELFVGAIALFYVVGIEAMGNPNSLGAVMGVVGAPILLWGTLIEEGSVAHHRRLLLCGVSLYLVCHSHSRAGIMAAFLTCGLLCVALRRYKLLAQGIGIILIAVTASAIVDPDAFSRAVSSLTASFIYKDKDPALGLLNSRQSPWQGAIDSIHRHFWFGTGFGITDNGLDASSHLSTFETHETVSRENGSSYLSIVSWVGLAGVLPFVFLLLALLGKIGRTFLWMLNTGNASHPAVPLALVVFAGLLHAGFEDWLFAPGYYLCVFFWSVAFILVDVAPWAPLPSFTLPWRATLLRQAAGSVAPGR
jgi:hypothetical protein